MRFRQPVELFHAAAQAHTKNLTPPDCNQRMRQLVAFAQRMLFAPWIQVGKDTFAAPFRCHHDHGKGRHQNERDDEEHACVDATQKQDAHRDHGNHHERPHVGLGEQQCADNAHRQAHGQHGTEEALLHLHLADHVIGRVHDDGDLGQLGRLEVHDAQ
ncbi:hypothetical protein D3C72_989150 [compost metagenome]